ncbi:hypothetical protein HIM_03508 [Hirsutella minnesotensis 3608]|uniref:Heme haloperoxidase family profile domain-containing protein n=1 Tax=Hirsutella minnesotensis 3608 TaxID=1043627 RepID=A0A0F8A2R3_9HYPO|nr:hypothetical protein HIM_03508 [Hirsutella minnesotensis 3608]
MDHAQDADQQYVRGNIDNRGPCPAMNALANHGYLPRDGKNLTIPQVKEALKEALSMTPALAALTSRQLHKIVRPDGTFYLTDLRQHGVIEHDRSLTRLDYRQGDNYSLQPAMLHALLDDARGSSLTVKSLAQSYNRRAKEHRESGGDRLTVEMWFVNLIQTVSFFNVAQSGGLLSKEAVEAFYGEERLPGEVLSNKRRRTLPGLFTNVLKLLYHIYMGGRS